MTKSIVKVLMLGGICAGILGAGGDAKAWTPVAISPTYGTWGATQTDWGFFGSVSARARKRAAPERGQLDITANTTTYTSSLSLWCTSGFQQDDRWGTTTTDGDITLTCAGAGTVTNAGGAIQAD